MSRFDHVQFSEAMLVKRAELKHEFEKLENRINEALADSTEKTTAMTKLEESFMWIGKAMKREEMFKAGTASYLDEDEA